MKEPKEILKEAREKKGLTQTQLAEAIGIGLRMYQKIEDGNFPKYKVQQVQDIDRILNTNLYELIYVQNRGVVNGDKALKSNSEIETPSYTERRLNQKNSIDEERDGIVFIPISAQAGYVKRIMDSGPMKHEKIFIPGFPYRGDQYRYFEVSGDSMLPTLEEGFYVLTEMVEQGQWDQQADFYTYVIVTTDQIMIKRIFKKSAEDWVIISDNEEFYDQFILKVSDIKELWKVKRKIDWKMAPPKKFTVKV